MGWVGLGWVEENDAVRMRYCKLLFGRRVGLWVRRRRERREKVGGWVVYLGGGNEVLGEELHLIIIPIQHQVHGLDHPFHPLALLIGRPHQFQGALERSDLLDLEVGRWVNRGREDGHNELL